MDFLLIKTIMILGLNKTVLKAAFIFGVTATFFTKLIDRLSNIDFDEPINILGVTIFLWLTYIFSVFLDWKAGIQASRYEAKKNKKEFVFDRDKANTSWYKHALFIIVIGSIYYMRKETIRMDMNNYVTNLLIGIQYIYFGYNMMTEWISIEKHKFRITNKKTRLYKLLTMVLDTLDKGAAKKMKDITNTIDND